MKENSNLKCQLSPQPSPAIETTQQQQQSQLHPISIEKERIESSGGKK